VSVAEKISMIVAQMPERNQTLVLELVKTMISPDDILTDEDIADIKQARSEFARGEFVRDNEINWK
jgi:hypothetical protein